MSCKKKQKKFLPCNAFKHYLTNFRPIFLNYRNDMTETQINKLAKIYFKKDKTLLQTICPKPLRKRCYDGNKTSNNNLKRAKYYNFVAHLPNSMDVEHLGPLSDNNLKFRNNFLRREFPKTNFSTRTIDSYYNLLKRDIANNEIDKLIGSLQIKKRKKRNSKK